MRLYDGTVEQFRQDVMQNKISDIISKNYKDYYGTSAHPSEISSWNNSLNFMKNALDYSELKDNELIIEYELPYSERRIDVLLFGKDVTDKDNIVLIELKQWSNNNVKDCEVEGNILLDVGKDSRIKEHPSLQVQGYHFDIKDFMAVFETKPEISLNSCVYCHNYSRTDNAVLYAPKFTKLIGAYPIF